MWAIAIFHVVVAVVLGVRVVRSVRRQQGGPSLDVHGDTAYPETVSVIVPARNEGMNIERCVRSLVAARGAVIDVIIVDDHSEDETGSIARTVAAGDPRVQVVRGLDLEAGWTGKSFALHQGAARASGEWLLFVDADVELSPAAVISAIAHAQRHEVALLSLSPAQRCESFWEHLLQPVVFEALSARYDLRAVNDPTSTVAAANGQFILIRRSAYEALGGHAAIKGRLVDDVALAELVKHAGRKLRFANTDTLAHARMYRDFRTLWAGWSKNLYLLLGARSGAVLRLAVVEGATTVVPLLTFTAAGLGVTWQIPAAPLAFITGAAAVAALLALSAVGPAWARVTWTTITLSPVARAMFVAMIVSSWYGHAVRQSITWKGRRYASGRLVTP